MNSLIIENQIIASVLLLALAMLLRWLVIRHLKKLPSDEKELSRRWVNSAKNAINMLIVLGLIIIWLSELRFVALSIATFMVALIIATREFIQCFLGALYQTSTRAFAIGDWIKIGNHYGEVVSSDWLTTQLLEVDIELKSYEYTGKTLIIPNNQFVANPIVNLNTMRRYVSHTFVIVRDAEFVNVFQAKDMILAQAKAYSEPFANIAQRYDAMLESRFGVNIGGSEPSVRITTSNLGKNQFEITVYCPTNQAKAIEQKLTEDFMKYWYNEAKRFKAEMKETAKFNDS